MLWAEAHGRLPRAAGGRPSQPVFVLEELPEPGGTGLRGATTADVERLLPACALAHREELGVDPLARDAGVPVADAHADRGTTLVDLARGRHHHLQGRGVGVDALGRSAAAGLGRPRGRRLGNATRAMRDLCRLLLGRTPRVCLFVRPENAPAIRLYETIGMRHVLSYRSLVF